MKHLTLVITTLFLSLGAHAFPSYCVNPTPLFFKDDAKNCASLQADNGGGPGRAPSAGAPSGPSGLGAGTPGKPSEGGGKPGHGGGKPGKPGGSKPGHGHGDGNHGHSGPPGKGDGGKLGNGKGRGNGKR
jgi:hypothetical protein